MSKKFKRQENWKYKRLTDKWRKPRGANNPIKKGAAGRAANPAAGFGTKRSERYLHPTGLREVLVSNLSDMKGLDPKTQIVRIRGGVGKRKRLDLFKRARETGIKVIQNEPKSSEKNSK